MGIEENDEKEDSGVTRNPDLGPWEVGKGVKRKIPESPGIRMTRFGPLGRGGEIVERRIPESGGEDGGKEDSGVTRNPGDSIWALGRGRDEMEDSGVTRNLGDSIWVLGKRER